MKHSLIEPIEGSRRKCAMKAAILPQQVMTFEHAVQKRGESL